MMSILRNVLNLALIGFLGSFVFSRPYEGIHRRQVTNVEIPWASITPTIDATTALSVPAQTPAIVPVFLSPPFPPPPQSTTIPSRQSGGGTTITATSILVQTLVSTVFEPTKIITVTAPPTTVTRTVTVSDAPTTTSASRSWSARGQFSDLTAFKIKNFAFGKDNLQIIQGIPPNATKQSYAATDKPPSSPEDDKFSNSSSVLQLFYPAGSFSPSGSKVKGGADFYATPLPLADATNVSLEYYVQFPPGFDWVKGGKLPGLYGGHTGCSGGNPATSCFSTRCMWRSDGAGELYLYVPKDKQTDSLCHTPPRSECNHKYGFSIGRGSFSFTAGQWTHLRQTVVLNTPGKQNGGFRLEVNGDIVLERTDILYRDQSSSDDSNGSGSESSTDGGLLDPLLRPLLSALALGSDTTLTMQTSVQSSETPRPIQQATLPNATMSSSVTTERPESTCLTCSSVTTVQPTITQVVPQTTVTVSTYLHAVISEATRNAQRLNIGVADTSNKAQSIGFTGLFFRLAIL